MADSSWLGPVPGAGGAGRPRRLGGAPGRPGVGQASRVSIIAQSGQGSPVETRTFFH